MVWKKASDPDNGQAHNSSDGEWARVQAQESKAARDYQRQQSQMGTEFNRQVPPMLEPALVES